MYSNDPCSRPRPRPRGESVLLRCLLHALIFCEISATSLLRATHTSNGVVAAPPPRPQNIEARLVGVLNAKREQVFESQRAFTSRSDLVKRTVKTLKEDLYTYNSNGMVQAQVDSMKAIIEDNLVYSIEKMIARFEANRGDILTAWSDYGDAFDGNDPLRIKRFKIMNNDPHHKGGRVIFIYVQDKKIVYKPSSVDANFVLAGSNNPHSFFTYVNRWIKEGGMLVESNVMRQQLFMSYPVISASDDDEHSKYGFIYFLAHYDMRETRDEMPRGDIPKELDRRGFISTSFMAGQLLAIMTLFRVHDLHVENLMAVETRANFRCNSREDCYALKGAAVPAQSDPRHLTPPTRFVQLVPLDVETMFTPDSEFTPYSTIVCRMYSGSFCPTDIMRNAAAKFDENGNYVDDSLKHDPNAVIRYRGYVGYPPDNGLVQTGFADMFDLLVAKKNEVLDWFDQRVPANSVVRIVPLGTPTMKAITKGYHLKLLKERDKGTQNPEKVALLQMCSFWFKQNARRCSSDDWKCRQHLAMFGGSDAACDVLYKEFLSSLDIPAFYYQWNSKSLHLPQLDQKAVSEHVDGLIEELEDGSNKDVAKTAFGSMGSDHDEVLTKTLKQVQIDFVRAFLVKKDAEACTSARSLGKRLEACMKDLYSSGLVQVAKQADYFFTDKKKIRCG